MTRWGRLLHRRRLERELDAELRDHIERAVADGIADGLSEAEARRRAALTFGGLDQVKEACRDVRGTRWLEEFAQDIRHGARLLAKAPGFTAVAVLSLALGIGANTAIFSLVDSLLLRALPVKEPQRLALLDGGSWTNPIWEELRDRQVFTDAAAWSETPFNLAPAGESQFVNGLWTSGRFFEVLGVSPILGRTFTSADDRRGGGPDGPVAVISHRFWQQHFGGAADAIGRTITLDGVTLTVVGITPPEFFGPTVGRAFDVAVPIGQRQLFKGHDAALDNRSMWWLEIIVRLQPGQTIEEATAALRSMQPQIRQATLPANWRPEDQAGYLTKPFTLVPAATGSSYLRSRYRDPLVALLGIVGLVLLMACANVANVLLARAESRRHEFSMRLGLGGSRARIVRQLLAESLLLAAVAAAVGLLLAVWIGNLLVTQISGPGEPIFLDLTLDRRTLAFVTVVSLATAFLFGLAPAIRAGRAAPLDGLKDQARTLVPSRGGLVGGPLVVVQVALSLAILVGAGLFIRTFVSLVSRDLGFDRDGVLVVNLDAQRSRAAAEDRAALFERVRAAAASVPGVAHASVSLLTPASGAGWNTFIDTPASRSLPARDRITFVNAISPGWFATYGTRILAGRDFAERDAAGAPAVAIVNETFVRRFLDGVPLGQTVGTKAPPGAGPGTLEIIGVVEDAIYFTPRQEPPATLYLPVTQLPAPMVTPFAALSLRAAAGTPAPLSRSVVDAVTRVDPALSLTFRPLAEQVDSSITQERVLAMLSGFFAALALVLAGIGLYGVAAQAVGRRRAEIGIRMALGADARRVIRLLLGRIAILMAVGLALGTLATIWASRLVASLLFGVDERDPAIIAAAGAVLLLVGLLATAGPARRAARIDPAQVLREG